MQTIPDSSDPLLEATISAVHDHHIELQLPGNSNSFKWPKKTHLGNVTIGQKMKIELKSFEESTQIPAKESKDPAHMRKLLENLIN